MNVKNVLHLISKEANLKQEEENELIKTFFEYYYVSFLDILGDRVDDEQKQVLMEKLKSINIEKNENLGKYQKTLEEVGVDKAKGRDISKEAFDKTLKTCLDSFSGNISESTREEIFQLSIFSS